MSKLYLLTPNSLHTQKAISLVELFHKKVVVPTTIIFQDEIQIKSANDIIKALDFDYFYVRLNFPDNVYPHHFSTCSSKNDILIDLRSFIKEAKSQKKNKYDIIIQPILNFQWSGVALVKDDLILIEIVFGHPISLLRLGEFKFRFLFNKQKHLLDVNEGTQYTYMEWEGSILKKSNEIIRSQGFDQILNELRNIRSDESLLYEFGYSDPDFYYLEFKHLNPSSFPNFKDSMLEKPFIVFRNNDINSNKQKFSKPALENLKGVTKGNEVSVESGAFLSHFSTYCAQEGINCLFLT
jgi:hypothetical protein